MAFLQLNGIALSILSNTGEREELEIGEGLQRAFDGSPQRSTRGYKRAWAMTTIIDTPAISRAFMLLAQGRLQHMSFDTDLYSDQGLGPASSSGAVIVGGGAFANAVQLAATTGSLAYAGVAGPSGVAGCTVLVQRYEAAVWVDYALTWDATGTLTNVYRAGVAQTLALPAWLTFVYGTGTVTLLNTAGSAQLFDDLVVFAFEAPVGWLAQIFTFRASSAWTFGGKLKATGTLGTAVVTAKVGKAKLQPSALAGVAYDAAESFGLELWEA